MVRTTRGSALATLTVALALAGCTSPVSPIDASTNADATDDVVALPDVVDAVTDAGLFAARPYRSRVPRVYDPAHAAPLVVLLHGYSAGGGAQDLYFGLGQLSEQRGFLYAYPDGTFDADGRRFWNAFPTSVDGGVSTPDDVAYIMSIIDDMSARYNVDPRRVFLVGHSNGAFMAYRLACERSTRIAAIVGLAGAMLTDPALCTPTMPVAILHVHGDADTTIPYVGGTVRGVAYLGAVESLARWATFNRCGPLVSTGMMLDLEATIPGAETTVRRHDGGAAGAAELWTMAGAQHLPGLGPTWANTIYTWLAAHPRM